MTEMDDPLLLQAYGHATAFLAGLPERPVAARVGYRDLLAAIDTALLKSPTTTVSSWRRWRRPPTRA